MGAVLGAPVLAVVLGEHEETAGLGEPKAADLRNSLRESLRVALCESLNCRRASLSLPPSCHRTHPKDVKTRLPEPGHQPPFLAF